MISFKQFITETSEKPYPNVLFHFTGLSHATDILKDGRIELSTGVGTVSDRDERVKGSRPFFLSLSRNPVNDYSETWAYRNGVLFAFDKDYLHSRYKIVPKDFWERQWLVTQDKSVSSQSRTSEQEERVWSKNPYIDLPKNASRLIRAIHVMQDPSKEKDFTDYDHANLRRLLLNAKKLGIPIYYYDNPKDFLTTNQLKRKKIHDILSQLRGTPPSRRDYQRKDWLKPWRELIIQRERSKLSDAAKRTLDSVLYYDYDAHRGLEADIHNAVKSGNHYQKERMYRTIQAMQRMGSVDSKEFIQLLKRKWRNIIDNPCKHPWNRAKDKSICGKRASKS